VERFWPTCPATRRRRPRPPLDALDVARAAGEPQEVGEELPWPDPERAGREHPELSPQIAWRRLALSELAALG